MRKRIEWNSSIKIGQDPVSSLFLWMEKKSSPTILAAEEASVSHGSSVSFSVNMQIAFIFIILQWSVFYCYLILCIIP